MLLQKLLSALAKEGSVARPPLGHENVPKRSDLPVFRGGGMRGVVLLHAAFINEH